jgi:hypothetical protein
VLSTYQAIASWHMNLIRVPLNEDCWLGINGVEVGGGTYQAAIAHEVELAHQAGLYVILDLHWSAPGAQRAVSQNPAPDEDHSPSFWDEVANAYKDDPAVIFDLYNEPYDYWGTSSNPWAGWRDGDVQTQYVTAGTSYTVHASWRTAGTQQLVDVIRARGATNPILVNGLDWANDDSGWLAHAPGDPARQLIAGAHIYGGQGCSTTPCWNNVYGAIESRYPVLIGETGDLAAGPAQFLPGLLRYADAHHWSYAVWTWNPWQNPQNILISNWSGTPTTGEGAVVRSELAGA